MDEQPPMSSCVGAYRKPNECSRNILRRVEATCGCLPFWREDTDAVPPVTRHVCFLAQREPHGTRGLPGGQRLVGGASTELPENQVTRQDTSVCATELGRYGNSELAEFHFSRLTV